MDEIGPLQAANPIKPSNRGRKPMQSSVLTSPESITALKVKKATTTPKATKKKATSPAKPPSKRAKKRLSPPLDENDFASFVYRCCLNIWQPLVPLNATHANAPCIRSLQTCMQVFIPANIAILIWVTNNKMKN